MPNLPVLDSKDFSPVAPPKKLPVLDAKDFSHPSLTWGETGKQAVENLIPSAINVGESMAQPFLHPFNTAKTLIGSAATNTPLDAATKIFRYGIQKYGSEDKFKEAISKDPAGTLSDIATVLYPLSGVKKLSGIARKIDPAAHISKIPGVVGKAAKNAVQHEVGYMSGVGPWAVEKAMQGSPEFKVGQRGGGEMEMIRHARSALQTIKEERHAEYAKRLEDISNRKNTATLGGIDGNPLTIDLQPIEMNLSPIHKKLDELMKSFKIDSEGNPMPGGAYIAPEHRPAVRYMIQRVGGHGNLPLERSPLSVDILKRDIRGAVPSEGSANAFGTALHSIIRGELEKQVPGYAKMTSDYANKSGWITEMQKGLSLGPNGTTDTAMRKLLTGIKEHSDLRRKLIDTLDAANPGLSSRLAGYQMKEWAPRIMGGRNLLGAEGAGALGAALLRHPAIAATLAGSMATSSPKLMGLLLHTLGKEAKRMAFIKRLKIHPQIVYRSGQAEQGKKIQGGNP